MEVHYLHTNSYATPSTSCLILNYIAVFLLMWLVDILFTYSGYNSRFFLSIFGFMAVCNGAILTKTSASFSHPCSTSHIILILMFVWILSCEWSLKVSKSDRDIINEPIVCFLMLWLSCLLAGGLIVIFSASTVEEKLH